MPPLFRLIAWWALLACSPTLAATSPNDCDKLSEALREQLRYPADSDPENNSFTDCKTYPLGEGQLIIATARPEPGATSDESTYDLDLALVRVSDGRVLKRSRFNRVFESDAVRFDNLKLDLAPFSLAPGVRAIGVRAYSQTYSRAAPHEWEYLSLYVETAGGFRRVLDALEAMHNGGENNDNCSGSFEHRKRTVAVLKSSTRGYADLQITTRAHRTSLRKAGNDCLDVETRPTTTRATLKYDGSTYPKPAR